MRQLNVVDQMHAHQNFLIFWGIQNVSSIGSWAQSTAINVILAQQIQSSFMLALVHSAWFVAILLILPFSGKLADKGNKLSLLQITKLLSIVLSFLFFVSGKLENQSIFYALTLFGFGVLWAIEQPTSQSVIPEIVKRELLPRALSFTYMSFHLARFLGPLCLSLVTLRYSIWNIFLVNAFIMLVSALLLRGIKIVKINAEQDQVHQQSCFQYVRTNPKIQPLILMSAINSFFILPALTAMTLRYSHYLLKTESDFDFSAIASFIALGGILGTLVMPNILSKTVRNYLCLAPSIPLYFLQFSHHHFYLILVAFFILSASLSLSQSSTQVTLQTLISDQYRARIISLNQWIFACSTAFSCIVQGYILDTFPLNELINFNCIGFVSATAICLVKFSLYSKPSNLLKESQHEIP